MVEQTNNYALYRQKRSGRSDALWHPTDIREMRAYVGLNILMGINQLPDYGMYWASDIFIGNAGFKKTMTARRFEKLNQNLHLCDRESEPSKGELATMDFTKYAPCWIWSEIQCGMPTCLTVVWLLMSVLSPRRAAFRRHSTCRRSRCGRDWKCGCSATLTRATATALVFMSVSRATIWQLLRWATRWWRHWQGGLRVDTTTFSWTASSRRCPCCSICCAKGSMPAGPPTRVGEAIPKPSSLATLGS